ncbi:MAG: DUF2752 domain-containing protein [Actinomycetota bacterium]|nr:DUF2752 domain-containing protein [Actinomycetota bacterium]
MTASFPASQRPRPAWAPTATRLTGPAFVAAATLAATAVVHVRDPHESASYGLCPWLALTGTYCPGCGGLRAVHDLTHGDLTAALSSNLLVVALLPVAVLLWACWAHTRWRGHPPARSAATLARPALWSLGTAAALFTLLRNLGPAAWLAP